MNFCRLPLSELAGRATEAPTVEAVFESLFDQSRSLLIDIEYLSAIVAENEDAAVERERVFQLQLAMSREVFSPVRWALVAIHLADSKPDRPPEMSQGDLWQSYYLLGQRFTTLQQEYGVVRERVFTAIGIDPPNAAGLERPTVRVCGGH